MPVAPNDSTAQHLALEAAIYILSQFLGGIVAGYAYYGLFGEVFDLKPAEGFGWKEAWAIETLYTFMLCFVVLNVAATKKTADNQYFGLAIGFVIIAGGYAGGAISGGI